MSDAPHPLLSVNNIEVIYDHVILVLKGVSLEVPDGRVVALLGANGAGKSTFAARHFLSTETISSDFCRALVSDDENDMPATAAAFRVLHAIAGERLRSGRIAVVDATSVQPESRKSLIQLGRDHDCLVVAIVFDLPEKLCVERNRGRANRNLPPGVIHRQRDQMRRSMRGLQREGFRYVYVLDSVEAVEAATIVRQPLWVNRRGDRGPFDIIGDVHGCHDELVGLLQKLGYAISADSDGVRHVTHAQGRSVVFVGDLVDRGPDSPGVLRLVMTMVRDGIALCVAGNHDQKLSRALRGRDVKVGHGLERALVDPHRAVVAAAHVHGHGQAVRAAGQRLVDHGQVDLVLVLRVAADRLAVHRVAVIAKPLELGLHIRDHLRGIQITVPIDRLIISVGVVGRIVTVSRVPIAVVPEIISAAKKREP